MPNFKLDERVNCLALVLMDALSGENESVIHSILEQLQSNTSYLPIDRGIAPLHFAIAIKNEDLAFKVTERLLKSGATPNVRSSDFMTPLHVAATMGRTNLVELLLQNGAHCDVYDRSRKTPLHYAIEHDKFEVLQLLRGHITKQIVEKTEQEFNNNLSKKPSRLIKPLELKDVMSMDFGQQLDMKPPESISTTTFSPVFPVGQNYKPSLSFAVNVKDNENVPNFPPPYVPNHAPLPRSFSMPTTRDKIKDPKKNAALDRACQQYIEVWKERVQRSQAHKTVLQHYDNINDMLNDIMEHEHLNFSNIKLNEQNTDNIFTIQNMQQVETKAEAKPSLGTFIQKAAQSHLINAEKDPYLGEVYVGRKPSSGAVVQYFLQMVESYVHTDDQNGLIFYENKYLSNETKKKLSPSTLSALNANTRASSYEQELASLLRKDSGIVNHIKRLYNKRVIKCQRQTPSVLNKKHKKDSFKPTEYSIELTHTVRSLQGYQRIPQYLQYETKSRQHFDEEKAKLRGPPLTDQYFIYLLLDPRMTCNLAGELNFLDNLTIWNRFLNAIFYVGKGKDSCPYAHLYDAMKLHSKRSANKQNQFTKAFVKAPTSSTKRNKSQKTNRIEKHVERILDIWQSNKGLVCLHIFHNSSLLEATTLQSAIVDAMGLGHLCNTTRGEYHGPALRWTMKQRKCLGISLLYNALRTYITEGESQIATSDLI